MIHDSLWDLLPTRGACDVFLGLAVGVFYVYSLLSNGMITFMDRGKGAA